MRAVRRIGLFGGSFNPVHLGHLLVAQAAREELQLTQIVFVPAAQSPFKPGVELAPAAARLRLLRLALAGWSGCEVDEQEIARGGVSYTIDTVQDYLRRYPGAELFYLVGTDQTALLPKWHQAQELARLVELIIIPRPGAPSSLPSPPFRGRLLRGFPLAVSASQIRQRVKAGLPIELLTLPAVAEAIRNYQLYL